MLVNDVENGMIVIILHAVPVTALHRTVQYCTQARNSFGIVAPAMADGKPWNKANCLWPSVF